MPLLALLLSLLLALVLPLLAGLGLAPAAVAAQPQPQIQHFVCAGDPLVATVHTGAVDAPGIPNSAGGTVPGAFIVLEWRGVTLQLPRTNNAGSPSYTDGRWWWQARDPEHPDFAQRTGVSGSLEPYRCEAQGDLHAVTIGATN